jgi:hypothetical protein
MPEPRIVNISIADGNILEHDASVAIFKYAQGLHGADRVAFNTLTSGGIRVVLPELSAYTTIETRGVITPLKVVFIGVEPLESFNYPEIRTFARFALRAVADADRQATTASITLHGPGYGLDEVESFNAEIAGLVDALQAGEAPKQLARIIMVELNRDRAVRLRRLLSQLLPDGNLVIGSGGNLRALPKERAEIMRAAGFEATRKVHVFVAMPFDDDMEDVFEFGIKAPVNERGYLCERADLATFVGDINQWVKERIATADLVVADLTGGNANVYLEVGYAWGTGRPTVLIADKETKLLFDVRTQRCLLYKNIKDLKTKLAAELEGLERGAGAQAG